MNRNIQMLRGIACVYICLQHFSIFNHYGYGAIGVEVFFVLSGYLTLENLKRKKLDKTFLINKCLKILPLYYLGTVVVFAVGICFPSLFSNLTFNLKNLMNSVLLIPENVFYIYPGWTLTYMFYFYILFFLANSIAKGNISKTYIWTCILILVMCGGSFLLPANYVTNLIKEYNSPVMIEFLFGLSACYFKEYILTVTNKIKNNIKTLMFIVGIGSVFFFGWNNMQKRYFLPTLVVTIIMVLCIETNYNEQNILYKLFGKIGDASYTIYILHPLLIRPIDKILLSLRLEQNMYVLLIALSLCIVVFMLIIADKLIYQILYYIKGYYRRIKNHL